MQKLKPDFVGAINNKGSALRAQGKLDEAIEEYSKVVFEATGPKALNNIGNALRAQGKLDEAIRAFSKAIEVDPKYIEAINNKGNALKTKVNWMKLLRIFYLLLNWTIISQLLSITWVML